MQTGKQPYLERWHYVTKTNMHCMFVLACLFSRMHKTIFQLLLLFKVMLLSGLYHSTLHWSSPSPHREGFNGPSLVDELHSHGPANNPIWLRIQTVNLKKHRGSWWSPKQQQSTWLDKEKSATYQNSNTASINNPLDFPKKIPTQWHTVKCSGEAHVSCQSTE